MKVPVSIVYKKGFERNGKAPLFLYAYGSYGFGTPVTFSSNRVSLLDRGMAYAIAHIRGGDEMGDKVARRRHADEEEKYFPGTSSTAPNF